MIARPVNKGKIFGFENSWKRSPIKGCSLLIVNLYFTDIYITSRSFIHQIQHQHIHVDLKMIPCILKLFYMLVSPLVRLVEDKAKFNRPSETLILSVYGCVCGGRGCPPRVGSGGDIGMGVCLCMCESVLDK
jgi:hypothetical protein